MLSVGSKTESAVSADSPEAGVDDCVDDAVSFLGARLRGAFFGSGFSHSHGKAMQNMQASIRGCLAIGGRPDELAVSVRLEVPLVELRIKTN